jgi:hypothetical protein
MAEGAQLSLPFSISEESFRDRLCRAAARKISLTLTDNSASMISVRQKEDCISVRLHRIFLQADEALIGEIALFIRGRKGKTPLIRAFINQQSAAIGKAEPRRLIPVLKGKHHDLGILAESVNNEYFEGKITASVTWGTKRRGRYVRKRTLGSYSSSTNMIRINPVLDRRSVPSYFIRFVIYHEMLHAEIRCEEKTGRRSIHSAEFREREKMFREYRQALSWEKDCNIF